MKAQFEANLVLQHSTAQHSTAQHIEKLKRIRNEYLNTQENTTPRCFDNLGRQINCPDKWDAKVIKRKTKSGDFIIVK